MDSYLMLITGFIIGAFGGVFVMGILNAVRMEKYEYLLVLYSEIKKNIKVYPNEKISKIIKAFEEVNV